MKHRNIQSAHETSVIASFGDFLMRQNIILEVVSCPDPPDAIIKLDNDLCWLEVTDAFQSMEWARSLTSYAAEDKAHIPYKRTLIVEPDQAACEKVKEVILKKYNKDTMQKLLETHGQGILLVGTYTPLTSIEEIFVQAGADIRVEISNKKSIFRSIYLYENLQGGHRFLKLL